MEKLNPVLAGVTGEYFVAAELSKREYITSITLRNSKGVDILCSNSNATKSVGIQVKTNSSSDRSWLLNQKAEDYYADNLFYVFVNLNNNEKPPDFFVVPSKIVAKYIKEHHKNWLKMLGKKGQSHKDSNMRQFKDRDEEYINKWNLLDL